MGHELNSAAQAVVGGASRQFVENLLRKEKDAGSSEVDSVYKVMNSLEILAGENKVVALVLMACLAPEASRLYMHDVWDSIGLWMAHNMSEEIRKLLAELLANDPDAGMHRHYKIWMEFEGLPPKA
jgi:hypothetical protein